MRRSLILLLALAVLSVGVIAAAVSYVNKDAESVTYGEERLYGDPAAGRGLAIQAGLTYDGKLHWKNTITLGKTVETASKFHFTSDYTWKQEPNDEYLNLYCQSNMGMSSSGPIDFSEQVETAWLAGVLTAAAKQTPDNVEDYTVTVPLAPYVDYYEIDFDGSVVPWHWDEEHRFWDTATAFFHVPVQKDDVAEVTVSKDAAGNVYSVSYNLTSVDNIYGSGVKGPDGCWYLLFTAQDADGKPVEGTAPQGIYRIPVEEIVQKGERNEERWSQVVESRVELVYDTESQGILFAVEDDTRLLLTTYGEDGEIAVVFDWATMEPIQTFPISGHYTGNEDGWYDVRVENDHVVTLSHCRPEGEENITGQWTTVWAVGDDGRYEKVIDCDTTAGMEEDSTYSASLFDGERFIRTSYLDYRMGGTIHVQVCDGQGLQYAALLEPNLCREQQEYGNYRIQSEDRRPTPVLVQ